MALCPCRHLECSSALLLVASPAMPPKRRWADMADSASDDETWHSSATGTAPLTLAVGGPPFYAILLSYLRGLCDERVSRSAMATLQQVLRNHPRAQTLPAGMLRDLVFFISFDVHVKVAHAQTFVEALLGGQYSGTSLVLWQRLLQMECYVDFPAPALRWYIYSPMPASCFSVVFTFQID